MILWGWDIRGCGCRYTVVRCRYTNRTSDGAGKVGNVSEYTPTTEEVRIVHIGTREEFARPWQANRAGEFDRWLAAHDAEVRAGVMAEEPEWEYIGADMAGDPDWESLRTWGTVPEEQGKFRRRKAGPWEPVSAD